MGMTSASQVPRLLSLVPYLQAHPDADLADTAATFGVSTRQLVADLNVLWFCGLPGGMPGDLIEVDMDALENGRIRLTNADYLARPLRFTIEEAMSLVVALGALEEMADADLAGSIRSARAKLASLFGGDDRVDVRLQAGEEAIRTQLADAIAAGRAVRLHVPRRVPRDGNHAARRPRPARDAGRLRLSRRVGARTRRLAHLPARPGRRRRRHRRPGR